MRKMRKLQKKKFFIIFFFIFISSLISVSIAKSISIANMDKGLWEEYSNNPVLSPDVSWEGGGIIEPTVIYEDGIYKMWYRGNNVGAARLGFAISKDGIMWEKYSNNPVTNFPTTCPYILKVNQTYFMYYIDDSDGVLPKQGGDDLRLALSPDGINWKEQGIVLEEGERGEFDNHIFNPAVYFNQKEEMFHMLYEIGNYQKLAYANSKDGKNWTKYGVVIDLGGPDWKTNGAGNPDLKKIGDKYYAWFGGVNQANVWSIGHAISRDMINWDISPEPDNIQNAGWENPHVADPHLVLKKNKLKMWYGGGQAKIGFCSQKANIISSTLLNLWQKLLRK